MPDGLSFNGLSLAGPALTARDLSGLLSLPERRGENIPVPGRHGTVRAARKRYGGRTAPFEILVRGYDLDGVANVADPAGQVQANLDVLARALAVDVAPLVHTMDGGGARQVDAEARAAVEGERHKSGMQATVKVAFESADAFWRDVDPLDTNATLVTTATAVLDELDGGTAPIADPVITFGPGANPRLTDVASELWLAYDATIGVGQTLVVDCGEWELTGTGGLVVDRTKLRTAPGVGTWLELSPTVGGPLVQLTHTGGATMDVSVSARRGWLFG